ncbi:MAG: DUF4123 domain-containing protein, partial [Pyrinomonadaceae bacterium]|nr:DUF4123 domain-containing protein [Pyrinomonadaceae bacterium]
MDVQKFKEMLLGKKTRLYCVLDGAAVPDLLMKLYETQAPNFCLLRGKLPPDVLHAAPYVIRLSADNEITDWILEGSVGNNWGIFAQSRSSMKEMRRHFRALLTVHDEDGKPLIFRFYDPRVLRPFLPTCESDELGAFFGKVDSYFVWSDDSESIVSYQVEDGELKESVINLSDKK